MYVVDYIHEQLTTADITQIRNLTNLIYNYREHHTGHNEHEAGAAYVWTFRHRVIDIV